MHMLKQQRISCLYSCFHLKKNNDSLKILAYSINDVGKDVSYCSDDGLSHEVESLAIKKHCPHCNCVVVHSFQRLTSTLLDWR